MIFFFFLFSFFLYSPPTVRRKHLAARTRALVVNPIARPRRRMFVVAVRKPNVRHTTAVLALAVPVSEPVRGQHRILMRTQLVTVWRVRVVAEPVRWPVHVRLAAPAFRALGLDPDRLTFAVRSVDRIQHQPLTCTKGTRMKLPLSFIRLSGYKLCTIS